MRRRLVALALLLLAATVLLVLRGGEDGGRERAVPDRAPSQAAPAREAPPPAPGAARDGEQVPEAAATVEATTLRGVVLAEGRPLAGAVVRLLDEDGDGLERCASDERGAFVMHRTGRHTLAAAHPARAPLLRPVELTAGAVLEVTLELPPSEVVDLLVVDAATGAPVPGAGVLVVRAGSHEGRDLLNGALESVFGEVGKEGFDYGLLAGVEASDLLLWGTGAIVLAVAEAITDGAGRARLTGIPTGALDAIVRHPGYAAARFRCAVAADLGTVTVRLSHGGSLRVIAALADDRASEGATCVVMRTGFGGIPVGVRKIDGQGEARFPHLAPGTYRVAVGRNMETAFSMVVIADAGEQEEEPQPGAHPPVIAGPVTIEAGRETVLDLSRPRAARIVGRVADSGRAPEGAMALLLGGSNLEEQVGITACDGEGAFVFDSVAPGAYRVLLVAEGWSTLAADCRVREGDETIEVVLQAGGCAVRGRVVGPDGAAVPYAQVLVVVAGRETDSRNLAELMQTFSGQCATDENGTFHLRGLVPGTYRALCEWMWRLDIVPLTLHDGEEKHVEFRFEAGRQHRLVVELVDADEVPVRGVVVLGSPPESLLLHGGEEAWHHEFHLPAGAYAIHALAPGFVPVRGHRVNLPAEQDLRLTMRRGVTAEVTLVGDQGPLAGREIRVLDAEGRDIGRMADPNAILLGAGALVTDASGVVILPDLGPGPYVVRMDGREIGAFRVGEEPVRVQLRVE